MSADEPELDAREQELKRQVETRLRNVFIGCLVLLVFIVVHLSYFAQGPGGWTGARVSLVPTLLWALVVTTYAFHSLWRLARERGERLEQLAEHDTATGAYSYAFMREKAREVTEATGSLDSAAGFGYLKLSGIEGINDEYGHAVGNVVLRNVAAKLMDAAPEDAFVGRLAGQEFCVLAPGREEQIEQILEKAAERVRSYELDLGQRGRIEGLGVLFGVCRASSHPASLEELVRQSRTDAMDRVARDGAS
jgi:diguanylate cyclase (GGDEF)-like protein